MNFEKGIKTRLTKAKGYLAHSYSHFVQMIDYCIKSLIWWPSEEIYHPKGKKKKGII